MRIRKDIRRKYSHSAGVTLTELAVTIAIIGLCIIILSSGLQFLTNLSKEQSVASINKAADDAVRTIVREVKDANQIQSITYDTLVLTVFDFQLPINSQAFFDPSTFGTAVYKYTSAGVDTYIQRTVTYPTRVEQSKFMLNMLAPPTPTASNFLFQPFPLTATAPYNTVDVALRVGGKSWASANRVFEVQAGMRGQGR